MPGIRQKRRSAHVRIPALDETGYVVLDRHDQAQDPREWEDLAYVDWKSSGDTRFAPLASASGGLECNAFFNHLPPRTDKDGIWVDENVRVAPRLVARAREPGANVGRCRVIELQPTTYVQAVANLHLDDNNHLNPAGSGWVVRGFFNLTDDPDSLMILREDPADASTETRIPLAAGTQLILDTQRLWHAVWHPGPAPRYCLITSWESGPELAAYVVQHHGVARVASRPLAPELVASAQAVVDAQRWARRRERLRWEIRRLQRVFARATPSRV
jgi:hypothetical protein